MLVQQLAALFCHYIGVGNISVAYTDEVDELLTFYNNLNSLQASGGGDGPEYSLDAMLKALS